MSTKGIAFRRRSSTGIPPTRIYQQYDLEKTRWMMERPHATPGEYEAFIKQLVKRLGL
jgi:hypothetical protein